MADAAFAPRRRQDLRRPRRRVGGEHSQGDQDRRGDRAGGLVARRDGEGLLGHRLVEHVGRRHDLARVRHVRHLDAGEDVAGVRDRHRQRRARAAARAHAQGALRRDLLRRPAVARGAQDDRRDPPEEEAARSGGDRSRQGRRGDARVLRRRARAGGGLGALRRVRRRRRRRHRGAGRRRRARSCRWR